MTSQCYRLRDLRLHDGCLDPCKLRFHEEVMEKIGKKIKGDLDLVPKGSERLQEEDSLIELSHYRA